MADMAAGLAGARAGARIRLTQRELGNIVGMTRESVNKCLREWQRAGIVRIEANAIVIVKREELEQVAERRLRRWSPIAWAEAFRQTRRAPSPIGERVAVRGFQDLRGTDS